MSNRPKPVPARFWSSGADREPAREFPQSLTKVERVVIGDDLRTLQFSWPVGMPLSRPMGNGLHELRSNLPGNRTARLMFTLHDDTLVILHAFIKKARKTPKGDLDLAMARKKELEA